MLTQLNGASSEADVASGVLRVTINGQSKVIPTLKLAAFEDDWLPSQGEAIKAIFTEDRENPLDLFKLGSATVLDAIVAYDVTGALGGRDWLRNNADHGDLYAVARKIIERHFPFLKDVPSLLQTVRQFNAQITGMAVAQRLQETSTSSPSPDGDSTPDDSAVH